VARFESVSIKVQQISLFPFTEEFADREKAQNVVLFAVGVYTS
jgi:hypothetical protein